jgi:hypothetical protein
MSCIQFVVHIKSSFQPWGKCSHCVSRPVFYSQELFATRPTLKLEDHHLSAVSNCLFSILTATHHIGGCSSICNLRMRHTMVTGSYFSWGIGHVVP